MKTKIFSYLMLAALVTFGWNLSAQDGGNDNPNGYNYSFQFEFAQDDYVPCANGGLGEIIHLSGTLHGVVHLTVSPGGRFRWSYHYQPQGATATGEDTGDLYRATGITRWSGTGTFDGNNQYHHTFVNNYRMIGPGPDNNLLIHDVIQVNFNAAGEITVEHLGGYFECQ